MVSDELDKEAIDFFTEICSPYGFDLLSSKIFAILYLEPREMTMEELAEKTGYSPASICNTMKTIQKTGFLKEIHKPKTKKLYFTIEKDFSKHLKKMVDMIRKTKIEPAKDRLPQLILNFKTEIKKSKDLSSIKKLDIIEKYYKQILNMEKITNYIESQI